MNEQDALELLRKAVLACMDAKINIGVRPVDWAGYIEILVMDVGLQDGRFTLRPSFAARQARGSGDAQDAIEVNG